MATISQPLTGATTRKFPHRTGCGRLEGNNRLFEVVFVSLWYIGAISHVPVLDFMRATSTAVAMHIPLVYGMVAVALLLLACVGMQRQLQV